MKYICLDIGNVLCKVNFDGFLLKLVEAATIQGSAEEQRAAAYDFLVKAQALHDLAIVDLPHLLYRYFPALHHHTSGISNLLFEWDKTVVGDRIVLHELEAFIQANDRKVKIALLSNIGKEHARLLPAMLGETIFSRCIPFYSCEVGARKPSFIYYKTFLSMFPEFGMSLYIDDRDENVAAGVRFSLRSHKFDIEAFQNRPDIEKTKEVQRLLSLA